MSTHSSPSPSLSQHQWEAVIAFRKILVVSISTFGTLIGAVELQAFVALLCVFISIVVHLVGKPFDTSKKSTRVLHVLEFLSLSVCWFTFWGGLIFFLGPEVIPVAMRVVMSVAIVSVNCIFLAGSLLVLAREFARDYRAKKMARKRGTTVATGAQQLRSWKIAPLDGLGGGSEDGSALAVSTSKPPAELQLVPNGNWKGSKL